MSASTTPKSPPRALISVYDKTGLTGLGRRLVALGWELVSSGGTAAALAEAGIDCTEVSSVTASPEMLGGRVKTLHPRILGGILADRSKGDHLAEMLDHQIGLIDLVVCNLYPFESAPSVDLIDVGGPTMVRAAAKNWAHVAVMVSPDQYDEVLGQIETGGGVDDRTRRALAGQAFAHTAAYDAAIAAWTTDTATATGTDTDTGTGTGTGSGPLPQHLDLHLERAGQLRYGENPHQGAARYRLGGRKGMWDQVVIHSGLALSYLNIFDADAAWALVAALGNEPAAAIIKHANPCGAAVAASGVEEAYARAFECDPVSAFGGIVALNRPVGAALANEMAANPKADVVIAPAYDPEALAIFAARRKSMRVLEAPPFAVDPWSFRQISGGFLVQEPSVLAADPDRWRVATQRSPSEAEMADLILAWTVCAHVKSNAVVLARDAMAMGIGAGQQNRLDSARLATTKAGDRARGASAASDAFFPFRDGLDALAQAGVTAVVQPGGSVRDPELIAAANEGGLAMLFTGERQFRH
ncbi:MAG: bifunctional phosphoribosylaminoimidazolecarboxamide formyltransferase/IMP cyclohydrolase [Acidimicrobiales bacterium]